MNIDKFTHKSQEAIQKAHALTRSYVHPQIEPEHIVYALIDQEDGIVPAILARLGISTNILKSDLEKYIATLPTVRELDEEIQISRSANILLQDADIERSKLNDEFLSTEHIFLALLRGKTEAAFEQGGRCFCERRRGITPHRHPLWKRKGNFPRVGRNGSRHCRYDPRPRRRSSFRRKFRIPHGHLC